MPVPHARADGTLALVTRPSYALTTSLDGLTPEQLRGFFVDWPNPPTPDTFLRLLRGSYRVVLAVQDGQVIGFVQAISDGVLTAYIPLLEDLPAWQGRGVGRALMTRMGTNCGTCTPWTSAATTTSSATTRGWGCGGAT